MALIWTRGRAAKEDEMALTEEFDDIKKSSADPVNSGGEPALLKCHAEAQCRPDTQHNTCTLRDSCKAHERGGFISATGMPCMLPMLGGAMCHVHVRDSASRCAESCSELHKWRSFVLA